MVTITLASDDEKIALKTQNECYIIKNGDDYVGRCEFSHEGECVRIIKAECDDIGLLDGAIRQTLFYSLDKGCDYAVYNDDVKRTLYRLRIIKDESEDKLDILKFFKGYKCGEK